MPLGDDGEWLDPIPLSKPKRRPLTNPQRWGRAILGFFAVAIPVAAISSGFVFVLSRGTVDNRPIPVPVATATTKVITATVTPTSAPTSTTIPASDCISHLAWPHLVFFSSGYLPSPLVYDPSQNRIFVTDATGITPCLLNTPADVSKFAGQPDIHQPAWSNSAQELVTQGVGADFGWLLAADADGQHRRRLIQGRSPIWSPNGRYLLFSDTQWQWYVTDGLGSTPRLVTSNGVEYDYPVWASDSSYIILSNLSRAHTYIIPIQPGTFGLTGIKEIPVVAFLKVRQSDQQDFALVNYDAKSQTFKPYFSHSVKNLVYPTGDFQANGVYTFAGPDDQHLYIVVNNNDDASQSGVYLTDLEGSKLTVITVKYVLNLRWLPDRKHLSFWAESALWLMNPDGSDLHKIPNSDQFATALFTWFDQ